MDDDFSFAAVWGAPATPSPLLKQTLPPPEHDFPPSSSSSQGGDDFDDFGTAPTPSDAEDDDFGDFGDFGEAEEIAAPADFGEDPGFRQEIHIAEHWESEWRPLRINPMPSRADLEEQLNEILGPLWTEDISEFTTNEDIRQAEGVSQILVTPESRELYNNLFHSPPPTKPPNWTRSRIRQQHLISLGIPVNLDEVLPHANGKPLPPLQINTRPMSAPPNTRNAVQSARGSTSAVNSRPGTPQLPNRGGSSNVSQLALGPKPELDDAKISELIQFDLDALSLLPLATLEQHFADMRTQTVNASTLLTYLLQTREALQQDSETYNGLIAELVSEAQKPKTAKGRTFSKRGSGMM